MQPYSNHLHQALTVLLHAQVSHDRVPSARSSARSIHNSYHPAESPIPGDRQVFSRPYEHDTSLFTSQNSGLPPLPEVTAYPAGFSAMESAMSNPLYGGESAESVQQSEQQDTTAYNHEQAHTQGLQPLQQYSEPSPGQYRADEPLQDSACYQQQPEYDAAADSEYAQDSSPDLSHAQQNAQLTPYSTEAEEQVSSSPAAFSQQSTQPAPGRSGILQQELQPVRRQSTDSQLSSHHARRSSSLGSAGQHYGQQEEILQQQLQQDAASYHGDGDAPRFSDMYSQAAAPSYERQASGHAFLEPSLREYAQPGSVSNGSRASSRSQSLQYTAEAAQPDLSSSANEEEYWQHQQHPQMAPHGSAREAAEAAAQVSRPESASSQHSQQQGHFLLSHQDDLRQGHMQQGYSAQPRPMPAQKQPRQQSRGPSRPRSPLPGTGGLPYACCSM